MALTPAEGTLIRELAMRHDAELGELSRYDRYYEGTQPLTYMHPDILRELSPRVRSVIVFWPQLVVGSREERLNIDGFRLPGEEEADEDLQRIWQGNNLDNGSSMLHVDALAMRRAYTCVGTNEDDPSTPYVSVESPLETFHTTDPRTRKVTAALKRYAVTNYTGGVAERYGTLYLPNETIWLEFEGGWREVDRDEHGMGEVLVTPIVNRQRLRSDVMAPGNWTVNRVGRSELDAVIPLSDAVCKLATDMMVAAEYVALPLRALFGAGPGDFKDQDGNTMTPLQAIQGRMLTIPDNEIKAYEFAAAQMSNFGDGIKELAQMMSAVGAVPPDYLGYSHTNPASAEAGRVAETRLITRCERIQDAFGDGWEQTMRLAMRVARKGEKLDPDWFRLETMWRDPATPTVAAKADAAVKLRQAGITTLRQAREDLGYTDVQIERMELDEAKAAQNSPAAQLLAAAAFDTAPVPAGTGAPANA